MGNKSKSKGITSSGAKKNKALRAAGKVRNPNTKTGVNPHTGKEFLVIIKSGKKLELSDKTFQTRVGAEIYVNSNPSLMIVEKSNVINHIKKFQQKRYDFNVLLQFLPNDWQRQIKYL